MTGSRRALSALTVVLLGTAGCGFDAPDDSGRAALVEFTNVADGAVMRSPVPLQFESTGFDIAPSGDVVDGEAHFHVMVNTPCIERGVGIPDDDDHLHFGKAQLETAIELPPGEHRLCLQLGDGAHTALPVTDIVTITVEE